MERIFNLTFINLDGKEETLAVVAASPLAAYRQLPPHERCLWVAEMTEPQEGQ